MILLSNAFSNGCKNIKELDISLNEIGP